MRNRLLYAFLSLTVLGALGWIGYYALSPSQAGAPGGYPLVCTHCDHFFTLSDDELYTHAKSPQGEGFQCSNCGKFGARIASRCDKCARWTVMQAGPGGNAYCPRCSKPQ